MFLYVGLDQPPILASIPYCIDGQSFCMGGWKSIYSSDLTKFISQQQIGIHNTNMIYWNHSIFNISKPTSNCILVHLEWLSSNIFWLYYYTWFNIYPYMVSLYFATLSWPPLHWINSLQGYILLQVVDKSWSIFSECTPIVVYSKYCLSINCLTSNLAFLRGYIEDY